MAAIPNMTYSPGQPMQDFFDIVNQTIDAVNAITATNVLATKQVTGTWNADTNAFVDMAHGLTVADIDVVFVKLLANDGTPIILPYFDLSLDTKPQAYFGLQGASNIRINRPSGSLLDSPSWNNTSIVITILYKK